jgi:hypothetical protein
MPKWVRRIKNKEAALSTLQAKQLTEVVAEAELCAEDLKFAFETSGIPITEPPDYTVDWLQKIEVMYRQNWQRLYDIALVERLIALFLGQVIVRTHGAKWAIYSGTHYVYSPIVVELPTIGKFVQPFLVCANLRQSQMPGVLSGSVLVTYAANLEKNAVS